MTAKEVTDAATETVNVQPWWLAAVGTYGIPALLIMLWYFQVFKPDQDLRRELDRENATTLKKMGESMQMLVDQDRRRELISGDLLKGLQEQTRILQQIMIDQRAGAWNEPKKPTNGHANKFPE
jgi:hypothetical protein